MSYQIGDQVLFGRPGGEKTLGEVVGATRTGKLKIRQLERRGRGGRHAEGQVWTVPAELVMPADDASGEVEDEFDLDDLRIAFAYHHVQMIAQADGHIADEELALMERAFPMETLEACGFFDRDAGGFTDRFGDALRSAFMLLPEMLTESGKYELLSFFLQVCIVDGHYHPREAAMLLQAAKKLGIPERHYFNWVSMNHEALPEAMVAKLAAATADFDEMLSGHGTLLYKATQASVYAAAHGVDLAERERLAKLFRSDGGVLAIIASREEVEAGDISGWDALVQLLISEGLMLEASGRLVLATDGFDADPRQLYDIPEAKAWLLHIQETFPWLGAWLEPTMGGELQFVCCWIQPEFEEGGVVLTNELINVLVNMANYGAAFAMNLGSLDFTHQREFLAKAGFTDLPDDFFDGLEGLQAKLDENGRLLG